MRFHLILTLAFLISALSSQTTHAYCVQVALLDDGGQIISPGGLVVGMKVGETPVFNTPIPPHREQKEVREVPCPQDLSREMLDLYNRSCTSERAQQQMSVNNGLPVEAVQKRCVELRVALGSAE